jgi:hypothetical protein
MFKNILEKYLQKYSLNGNINSTVVKIRNQVMQTTFMTDDKSLYGNLVLKDIDIQDCKLGIYNTSTLQRILSVLNDNINIKIDIIDSMSVRMNLSDSNIKASFMLSDLSIFNIPPDLTQLPPWDIQTKIDNQFIQTFVKSKAALADIENFAVVSKQGKYNIVIGWATHHTDSIFIPLTSMDNVQPLSTVLFNANLLRDIFNANRECREAHLSISEQGILRVLFKVDNFEATYYLTAIQGDD